MAFPCPRCGDRYTQSLPMVFGTGTHVRNWRSRSGYRGSTVSQSLVGSLAAPPVKRSVWKPLLGLLLVWVFVGGPMTLAMHRLVVQRPGTALVTAPAVANPDVPRSGGHRKRLRPGVGITREQSEREIALVGACWGAISLFLLWRSVAALKFNRVDYPGLLRQWQSAFLCRGCGAIFHP